MSPSFATINWLSLNISGLTEIGSDGKITSKSFPLEYFLLRGINLRQDAILLVIR